MSKMLTTLFGLSLFAMLAFLASCGSGNNDGDDDNDDTNGSNRSALELSFLETVDEMNSTVSQFAQRTDQETARSDYRDRLTQDIDHLTSLWDDMHARCVEFNNDCPMNGGMTGQPDGQCMVGGDMMNGDQMDQLHGFIDSCRTDLDDFWATCGEAWNDSCHNKAAAHTQQMAGFLDQMKNDCNDWWSDDHMMSGGHNHWGECGDYHHDGGMMD